MNTKNNWLAASLKTVFLAAGCTLVTTSTGIAAESFSITGDLSTHIEATTDYRFRGVSRTFGDPALQAGAELAMPSQFYVGTWASTVDKQVVQDSNGIEWNIFGGYRWALENGLNFDVGLIQYVFLGESRLNTLEGRAKATFDFISLGYAYTLSNRFFGTRAARGSAYYDVAVRYPLGPSLYGNAHYGIQRIKDNAGDYTDYSVGIEKQWKGMTWRAAIVGTDSDVNAANIVGRTKDLGERGFVFSVFKAF